ncbi:MAG: HTH domain-containing protein [Pseudomonadota bacterium]
MARAKQQDLTWEEAIVQVLRRSDGAMHYADIAADVATQRLKRTIGANPAATVASVLSRALSDPETPFLRVGKGEYTLKNKPSVEASEDAGVIQSPGEESDTGALKAFGMFWRRSEVLWSGRPKLLGRQQIGAADVNFAEQVGVYLLHDRERVIYVGRAADTMHSRLKAHTVDRMGGRWDRFSWFGLRSVGPEGTLLDPSSAWTHGVVIETLEALLIESLEPPLNRKRGDNFSGVE